MIATGSMPEDEPFIHKTEADIREILDKYFESVIKKNSSSSKVTGIQIGEILKKTTVNSDKTIEVQISSIGFSLN